MKSLLFVLFMVSAITAHADVYKCVKDGKTSYGESRCDNTENGDSLNSNAGLNKGLAAFESGNYEMAYSLLNPLAQSGVAMAQNTIGRMYLQGQGVPTNPDKALILFRKAAKQGLPNAKNNLGVMYAAGNVVPQDYRQAILWFREAADQGFILAMNNLADMYEHGLGVKPDHTEADNWRKKSQGTGSVTESTPIVIETVGKKEYEKGLEFYYEWDFARAADWFQQAARKGHPEAQLKLATMYQDGQGVKKSEEQAKYWLQKAKSGAHTMDDNRDRVILIDTSSGKYIPPPPALTPVACGCPEGTPFGKCKCSVSAQGCSCVSEQ